MLKEVLINDKCKLEERKNQITTELCQLKKALEENQNKSIDADDKKQYKNIYQEGSQKIVVVLPL